jgi:hypothetical protein
MMLNLEQWTIDFIHPGIPYTYWKPMDTNFRPGSSIYDTEHVGSIMSAVSS